MNALANSQLRRAGEVPAVRLPARAASRSPSPATPARRTTSERQPILADPPDILLTNYVMLELLLTRPDERKHLIRAAQGLRFLVLDELHTYRGRQGADVALLVRRVREACAAAGPAVRRHLRHAWPRAARSTSSRPRSPTSRPASSAPRSRPERVIGETLRAGHRADATAERERSRPRSQPRSAPRARGLRRRWRPTRSPPGSRRRSGWHRGRARAGSSGAHRPRSPAAAAAELAGQAGVDVGRGCDRAIRDTLLRARRPATRRPAARSSPSGCTSSCPRATPSTSRLEPEDDPPPHRAATSSACPGRPEQALLPLGVLPRVRPGVLRRRAGQHGHGESTVRAPPATPTPPAATRSPASSTSSSDLPWPADPVADGPAARRTGSRPTTAARPASVATKRQAPARRPVWLRPTARLDAEGDGLRAWFVPAPFAFCLRCGVSYEQVRGSDFGKLATLDPEGRSSAVTVCRASVVAVAARPDADRARRRRPASCSPSPTTARTPRCRPATSTTSSRSALLRGACTGRCGAPAPTASTHDDRRRSRSPTRSGCRSPSTPPNPAAKFARPRADADTAPARRSSGTGSTATSSAAGGSRRPTSSSAGLLQVALRRPGRARRRRGVVGRRAPGPARRAPASGARSSRRILLDQLRRELAIDVDYLHRDWLRAAASELPPAPASSPWALDEDERVVARRHRVPARAARPGGPRSDLNVSGRVGVRPATCAARPRFADAGEPDDRRRRQRHRDLFEVLRRRGACSTVAASPRTGRPATGSRPSALRWRRRRRHQGRRRPAPRAARRRGGRPGQPVLRRLLPRRRRRRSPGCTPGSTPPRCRGGPRETARTQFREGSLPMLYCSPTMELGVDIAELNVVGLRNVPPDPGQLRPALRPRRPLAASRRSSSPTAPPATPTTRTSSAGSRDMVAGSVAAPRLDLANEDLVRSHVHAIWLAETGPVAAVAAHRPASTPAGEEPDA